jgi:hypothetical protein
MNKENSHIQQRQEVAMKWARFKDDGNRYFEENSSDESEM